MRGQDIERHAGVVAFAVAGRALDDGLVPGDAGLLRSLRDIVDVRTQRDHRLAFAPGGQPGGRNAGDAALDLEAFLLQNSGEILGGFEFLEAQLAEAEDAVDHHLRLLLHAVDGAGEIGLNGGLFFRRGCALRAETYARSQQDGDKRVNGKASVHGFVTSRVAF